MMGFAVSPYLGVLALAAGGYSALRQFQYSHNYGAEGTRLNRRAGVAPSLE